MKKDGQDRILILKTDAIGDYIIFRTFLAEIVNEYKGYKITLLGNVILKDLVADIDQLIITDFISINHKTLNKDWFKLFKAIASRDYALTIDFHHSRIFIADIFAFASSAKRKISMRGNDLNINPSLKKLFNLAYSTIIDIPENIKNEFECLKFYTEQIIGRKLNIIQPVIDLPGTKFEALIPHIPYVVFAPGAAVINRQSSIDTLVDIASYVLKKHNICFIGSPDESALVESIKAKIPGQYLNTIIDLTGKTPLSALPYILNESLGVICNDSGVYHIAVALKKPTLCLTGGGHFERFVKYPEQKNVRICYQPMPCFNCDWKCIYKFPVNSPYPCISAIELKNIHENFSFLENEFIINKEEKG